jgi:hypothetical protein
MTLPSLLFASLLVILFGALYHFVRGGGFWRLLLYLALSAVGFAAGHFVGLWRGWFVFTVGSLNVGLSTAGSFILLLVGDWLSRVESDGESTV